MNSHRRSISYYKSIRSHLLQAPLSISALILGIIVVLPATPALIISIALTFGHVVGVCSWLLYRFEFGYQACNGMFLIAAISTGIVHPLWLAGDAATRLATARLASATSLVAGRNVFGIGIYLFVWPREVEQTSVDCEADARDQLVETNPKPSWTSWNHPNP